MPDQFVVCSAIDQQFLEDSLNEFMHAAAARRIDYSHVAVALQRGAVHMAVMAGIGDAAIVEACETYIGAARQNVAKARALRPN
jgi:hypothetical protein